jgi:predicted esterase YcpF (UPF0227 family)
MSRSFILARKRFSSPVEAQSSAWTGGSIATRRIDNRTFSDLKEAIEQAEGLCASSPEFDEVIIYHDASSHYHPCFTPVADVYWDQSNHIVSTVTYPLKLRA